MTNQIFILTPVFNRKSITDHFLSQLKSQSYKNWTVILIDDGSTDGTSDMVRTKHPECVLLAGENLWWAGSLQLGIQFLKSQKIPDDSIILIANDDVEIPQNYLEAAVECLSSKSRVLLGSVCKVNEFEATDEYGIIFDLKEMRLRAAGKNEVANCLATRGLFLRWKDFSVIGEFRPRILPHYFSDYEFSIRAYQKGYGLVLDPRVWVKTDSKDSGRKVRPGVGIKTTMKMIFSNLNRANPLHFSIFVFLRCPGAWKFINQRVVVRGFLNDLRNGLLDGQKEAIDLWILKPVRNAKRGLKWLVRFPFRVMRKIHREAKHLIGENSQK